ncbi:MAG: BNR-4 repeat-containing protein [Chloroflexi bacterium]|nr:BNR-4 repeat-containing protein [Chloroflexota bacterium]
MARAVATGVSHRAAARSASTHVLSTSGSNRATAYPQVSNKIVQARGRIFVTWLDGPSAIKVATFDVASATWSAAVTLGQGQDNHAGAALTMDSAGFLYAAFGPHHGPFQFRRTLRPYDASAWESTEWFGDDCTHPSLVCGVDDTLHLLHRSGRSKWRLLYRRRPKGERWSEPTEVVDPCFEGYTHFWPSLAVAADGALHLAFAINTGSPFMGRAVGYLRSENGGRSWTSADGAPVQLPLTPHRAAFIEAGPNLQLTPSNLALDAFGHPWLAAYHRERRPQSLTLWHHDGAAWRSRGISDEVGRAFPGYEHASVNTMTFDARGRLYVAAVIQREGEDHGGAKDGWGESGDRVVLLTSDDLGETFDVVPVSDVDPARPSWLVAIERPYGPKPVDTPCLVYTNGGSGVSNQVESQSTEVIFVRLGESQEKGSWHGNHGLDCAGQHRRRDGERAE